MCKTTVKTFNADVKINGLGKVQKNQMSQVVNKSEKEQNFWQPYSTAHILQQSRIHFFARDRHKNTVWATLVSVESVEWEICLRNVFHRRFDPSKG